MAATIEEVVGSRSGNSTSAVRKFIVRGALDESEVFAAVATMPITLAGLPFADFSYEEREQGDYEDVDISDYDVTLNYGAVERTTPQPAGTSEFRFNFQAPSGHIYQSLSSISATEDPEILPWGAPPSNGLINMVNDDGKLRVEGFNLQAPAEVFSVPYTDVSAVIDATYLAVVKGLCGKVNNASFQGAAAGEIMLARAQGSRKNGLWNLDFGFAYVANTTDIPVGDNIVVPAKDGLDLLWVYYGNGADDTAKVLLKKPWCAYVERVFERADLNDLNLP